LGKIKLVYHREIPQEAMIKTLTIIKEGGKWFVCFSVELPDRIESKPKPSTAIGIDLGLNSFCGYVADRDHNAAKNILRLGLESLGFS
jgi:putative transposase